MPTYTEDTEETITIDKDGVIGVRLVTITLKDGVEVGRAPPWRVALVPGDNVAIRSERVQAVASTVWTPAVRAKWAQMQADARRLTGS